MLDWCAVRYDGGSTSDGLGADVGGMPNCAEEVDVSSALCGEPRPASGPLRRRNEEYLMYICERVRRSTVGNLASVDV